VITLCLNGIDIYSGRLSDKDVRKTIEDLCELDEEPSK